MWNRIFDMDNPVMRALGAICDLLVLNLLAMLCSLPVVTAGAALTALDDVMLRIVRREDCTVVKGYFRAFRANFKHGVALGIIFLLAAAVLYVDFLAAAALSPMLRVAVVAAALIVGAIALYAFALLARYENTLLQTLKNAAALSVAFFPRTLGLLVFTVALWLACLYFFQIALPVLLMFGLSLPAYIGAILFSGIFQKIENENEEEDQ